MATEVFQTNVVKYCDDMSQPRFSLLVDALNLMYLPRIDFALQDPIVDAAFTFYFQERSKDQAITDFNRVLGDLVNSGKHISLTSLPKAKMVAGTTLNGIYPRSRSLNSGLGLIHNNRILPIFLELYSGVTPESILNDKMGSYITTILSPDFRI